MDRLERALAAIDALHLQDPTRVVVDGAEVAAELDYARRMSAALGRLVDEPTEALRIAVRAQHLCRWKIPRGDHPVGKAGYHAWRTAQKRAHAELAAETLGGVGYDAETIARVGALIEKRSLSTDPEAQTLEDAACLVFIERDLAPFAERRTEADLVVILRKTWKKMSPAARDLALAIELTPTVRALVELSVPADADG